jgi:hypothetical protein
VVPGVRFENWYILDDETFPRSEGMPGPTPRRFKLSTPVSAVKLEDHPGSRLRSPTGILVDIPADSIVELEGVVSRSGLINVLWNGDAFSVFYEDFEKNTSPLS